MLLNLHKKSWMEGLTLQNYHEHSSLNEETVKEILGLAKAYNKVGNVKKCIHCMYVCIYNFFFNWYGSYLPTKDGGVY